MKTLLSILLLSLVSCAPKALVVPSASSDENIAKQPEVTESVSRVREGVRDGGRQLEAVDRKVEAATRSAATAKAKAQAAQEEAARLRDQGSATEEELAGMERQNGMLVDLVGKLEAELGQVKADLETALDQRMAMERWADDAIESSIKKDAELAAVSAERDRFRTERDKARSKLQGFADAEKKSAGDAVKGKTYKSIVVWAAIVGTLLVAFVIFLFWLGRQNPLGR